MIKYKYELSERDFYRFFLRLHSVNQKSKEMRLSDREIEFTSEIMMSEYDDPFHGKARERLMRKMGIKSASFSILISTLIKKGILVRLDKRDYHLAFQVKSIRGLYRNKYVNPLTISFEFKKQEDD
jgi:hypothetical protein